MSTTQLLGSWEQVSEYARAIAFYWAKRMPWLGRVFDAGELAQLGLIGGWKAWRRGLAELPKAYVAMAVRNTLFEEARLVLGQRDRECELEEALDVPTERRSDSPEAMIDVLAAARECDQLLADMREDDAELLRALYLEDERASEYCRRQGLSDSLVAQRRQRALAGAYSAWLRAEVQ
jgi:RNA polymerase sigma factor (sigma-70 family)